MKTLKISLVIFALGLSGAQARAELKSASCSAPSSPVCEKWKAALPERFSSDLRTCNAPADGKDLVLSCGKRIGTAVLNYAKFQGSRQLMLQLTTQLGITGTTTSLMIVAGKVYFAYKAAQFVYEAFKKDAECFYDHDYKRSILEPVAHFYPPAIIDTWVENRGCTDLGQFVYQKTQAVEQDISARRAKQREFENSTRGRNLDPALVNRLYPEEYRTLTPQEIEYLAKKDRMEKATPLFDALAEILPCLSPEAVTRVACGFVAQLGIAYAEKGDIDIYEHAPDLESAIKDIILNGAPFSKKKH